MSGESDQVALGEIIRRLTYLEADQRKTASLLTDIQITLAQQGMQVRVIWAALGMGASALVTALVSLALTVITRGAV